MVENNSNKTFKRAISIAAIGAIIVATTLAIGFNNSYSNYGSQEQAIGIDILLQPFTVEDLTQRSKFIIIGTVADKSSQTSVDEVHTITRVTSDITINVERDLKGRYTDKQISVKTLGGELDNIKVESGETARFSAGERVLVFVADKEPNTIWGDNYYVAGLKLGKYSLVDGKAVGPEYRDGIDEEEFLARIQNALAASNQ